MTIETKRLTLHSFGDEDMSSLCEILTNEIIGETYLLPVFKDHDAVLALAKRLQVMSLMPDRYIWGVYLDGVLIGMFNDTDIQGERIEIGYAMHPDHHNRGFATEALRAVIRHLFEAGFSEVYAGAFESNAASIRVMEKAGMKKMNSRASIDYRGKTHRCVYYSVKKGMKS